MKPFPSYIGWMGGLSLILVSHPHSSAQENAFPGTLREYLDLGDEGVRIGETVFSEFRLLPLQTGTRPLGPAVIDVTPLSDAGSLPGFRFSLMDGATADDIFELHFSFRVTGSVFDGAHLSLSDVSASGNGGSDVSLGISNTGDQDTASLATLIAFSSPDAGEEFTISNPFAPATDITVDIDAVIDGGNIGRPGEVATSLGSATVRIGQKPPAAPAPPAVSGSGFVGPETFFIEFVTNPLATYSVLASDTLADGFATEVILSAGDGTAGNDGFERVEFSISPDAPAQFFRIEPTS